MSTMSQIIIASHWHTGTTILAKMLNACGMEVGNENTYWEEKCIAQCEHATINRIGESIDQKVEDYGWDKQLRDILFSYIEESHKLGWGHYGIKATHILQDECWKFFKPIFNEVWPDAQYIISIRHPLHIYLSTRDTAWPIERVIESFMSTVEATKELAEEGAIILEYPKSFTQNKIGALQIEVSLCFNYGVFDLFDAERARKGTVDTSSFDHLFPEVVKAYKELQSYVNV